MSSKDDLILSIMGDAAKIYVNSKKLYIECQEEVGSNITVFFDGYPDDKQEDLCANSGKQGGEPMPPRYSDGSFRTKGNILEYRFMYLEKQTSVFGHNKNECFDKRTALLTSKKDVISKNVMTLGKWLDEWYATYKEPYNGKASLSDIKYRVAIAKSYLGEKTPLKSLTDIQIQKTINVFSDKPNSQDKLFDVLNGALEKALKCDILKRNPCCTVVKTPYKAKKKAALEFIQQQAVYDMCSSKYRQLFFFACCTGIRIGRILELTRADVDFQRNHINVVKKQRKGLNETYTVPFLPKLWEEVTLPERGKLFPDVSQNAAKLYFYDLYKRLNIKGALLHTFRHTFISTCYFCKIDIKKLQMWAGHSTVDLTMNVYTHLLNQGTSNVLEYIEQMVKTL